MAPAQRAASCATAVPAGAPPISMYERRSTAGLRASAWGAHLGLLDAQLADVLVGGGALPALLPLGLLALLGLLGLLLSCGRLLCRRAAPRGAQMSVAEAVLVGLASFRPLAKSQLQVQRHLQTLTLLALQMHALAWPHRLPSWPRHAAGAGAGVLEVSPPPPLPAPGCCRTTCCCRCW